ncbi:MAG: helix-hairpin-helix domain-containing protein [Planctomycetota bacterium]
MAEDVPPASRASALALAIGAAALLGVLGWRIANPPTASTHPPRDPGFVIDINRANPETLQLLPGLGPSIAENVVRYREANGPFRDPAELEAVRMIGPVLRARIEPWVTIGPAQDEPGFDVGLGPTTPETPDDVSVSPH